MKSRIACRTAVLAVGATTALLVGCTSEPATVTGQGGVQATTPTATPSRRADPTATSALTPVNRTDAKAVAKGATTSTSGSKSGASTKRVEAPAASAIVAEVKYPDGLHIEVTSVKSGTVGEVGPGAITGQPYTVVAVTVTNKSEQAIVLNEVIPQVRYGSPARIAPPVYNQDTQDLSGKLAPGKSTKAKYAFSIPRKQFSNVTFALDVDGQHGLAVFKGEVK